MNVVKSSLENIRHLRKQKLNELLFPSFGVRKEKLLYGGMIYTFIENDEEIGYYIYKNSEILDFYIKKDFDYIADDCFKIVLEELEDPVINIRSDDNILINLVFNYVIELDKGGYLLVRDRRHNLWENGNSSIKFAPLSMDVFEDCWRILREEELFYNRDESQEETIKNAIGKNMFFYLSENSKIAGIGYQQASRNKCVELDLIMNKEYRNSDYSRILLTEMVKIVENTENQCFIELTHFNNFIRELMENVGFYVIAKYFTARIKGKLDDGNIKKRDRRYSLMGFRVL